MKPKSDFDPMFPSDIRRRTRPFRWIAAVLIVLAAGGLALRAGPIPPRRPGPRPQPMPVAPMPVPGGWMAAQQVPDPSNPPGLTFQPRDRFVIVAPAELDAAMVIRAREDIDPAMVFNPETRSRGSTPRWPAPVVPGGPNLPLPSPNIPRPR